MTIIKLNSQVRNSASTTCPQVDIVGNLTRTDYYLRINGK